MTKKKSLASALNTLDTKTQAQPVAAPSATTVKKDEAGKGSLPPSRQGKKTIAGHFDPEVSRQFKLLGAESDRSLQDMLSEAINDFFKKHGKPPIA